MSQLQTAARGYKYRELISLALAAEGVPNAIRPRQKLSEGIETDAPASHLTGIPGWSVVTRSDYKLRLSVGLDQAQDAARLDGAPMAALVQFRSGRPATEQFVVLTLATFAAVLRGDSR